MVNEFKNVDIIKKAQIVSYFLSSSLNTEGVQIIITDPIEYDGYGLVLDKAQRRKLCTDQLGNFVIKEDEIKENGV